MKKKIVFSTLAMMALFVTIVIMRSQNCAFLESSRVESLTGQESFWDMYIPNSMRSEFWHLYLGSADCIISTFYCKGEKVEVLWKPSGGIYYCCTSGSTNQCKPGGINNSAGACNYFKLGIQFWD